MKLQETKAEIGKDKSPWETFHSSQYGGKKQAVEDAVKTEGKTKQTKKRKSADVVDLSNEDTKIASKKPSSKAVKDEPKKLKQTTLSFKPIDVEDDAQPARASGRRKSDVKVLIFKLR